MFDYLYYPEDKTRLTEHHVVSLVSVLLSKVNILPQLLHVKCEPVNDDRPETAP